MDINDLSSVYFDIHWPEDRPFQVIGQGMDAVDWICVLNGFPEYASRVEIAEIHKLGGATSVDAGHRDRGIAQRRLWSAKLK